MGRKLAGIGENRIKKAKKFCKLNYPCYLCGTIELNNLRYAGHNESFFHNIYNADEGCFPYLGFICGTGTAVDGVRWRFLRSIPHRTRNGHTTCPTRCLLTVRPCKKPRTSDKVILADKDLHIYKGALSKAE